MSAHGEGSPKPFESADGTPAKKEVKGFAAYRRVFTYADGQSKLLFLLATACLLACGTALPILNIIFGDFVNQFNGYATGKLSESEFQRQVSDTALKLVYIFIAKLVLFYIGIMAISVASLRTSRALRCAYVEQTLRQEIAYFDQAELASIAVEVTNSGDLVAQGTADKLGVTLQALSTFVTAFIIALVTQWKLSLITMCIVPAIVVTSGTCITIDAKQETKVMRHYSAAGNLATETLSNIRMVHAYWGQPKVLKKYEGMLDKAEKEGMKKSLNYGVLFSMQYFCVLAGYALAFWQGIRMYSSGEITEPGDIITVIFAVLVAATSITQVAPQIATVAKSCAAAEKLFSVIDRESQLDPFVDTGVQIPKEKLEGHVRFENIDFAYPSRPDTQILDGLTIDFPANKTTALVGASGSGKSTIVGLLERWYTPQNGQITLDGKDVASLDVQWLRTRVRLVQQEPVLFNASVFDNVCNGIVDIDDLSEDEKMRRVTDACKSANAHSFIQRLPQGYHTNVGERAGMLSGGQKQRIAIARSIIANPKILLLDEATSALDPVAEKKVQAALDKVRKSRTTIMIAHKLSTVREADNIAVIDKGRVVEQGTHEELIDARGAYFRLVMAQDLGSKSHDTGGANAEANSDEEDDFVGDIEEEKESKSEVTSSSTKPNLGIIRCIFTFLAEQTKLWPGFLLVGIACVIGGLSYPALAILISRLIRSLQQSPSAQLSHDGNFYSLMIFITAVINLIAYFSMGYVTNIISQKLTRRYRSEIFHSALSQDIEFFDEAENTTGAIVSRLSTAPTQLQELLGFNVAIIFISLVNLVSTCILALVVGWKLALVVLFGALLPIVISAWLRFAMEQRLEKEVTRKFGNSAAVASEAVSAIRTVVSLAIERRVIANYTKCLDSIVSSSVSSFVWINLFFALAQAIVFAAMALTFWYGAQLVIRGEYTSNEFFIIFIAILFSGEACVQVSTFTTSLSNARAGANYILWIRNQKPNIVEHSDAGPADNEKSAQAGAIDADCLQFAYKSRPNAKVIDGVDIEVVPGQFAAFVGASGCGKSTMASLIERFYERTGGIITYNGTDISDLCPRRYRMNIAMVQQEPTLLSGTVRENIAFGLESEPSAAQIDAACKQANVYDFINSLPDGLLTFCGSGGTQLSGGQRQRIAIARALIREPNVLLLDEATSALDTESEKLVQAAVEETSRDRGMTTIAIAHRLATIKSADVIYVFGGGKVMEKGGHEELMEKEGMYYRMCLSQSLG